MPPERTAGIPWLIVEDDTALAELIATYLGRQGYAVTVIGRGDEALAVDRSVDVVISKLRRRFEEYPGETWRLKTVWGKGYLLSHAEWE